MALASPSFRGLWLTVSLAQTGFWLSTVTMQWRVAESTGSSPLLLGLLYFANLFPLLLLAPVAGAVIDRWDRGIVARLTTGALAVVALVGGLAHLYDNLPLSFTFMLAIVLGCLLAVQGPTLQTLLPSTLPVEGLPSGVALVASSSNLARIIGPAIAGALLAWFDAGVVILVYAAVMVLANLSVRHLQRHVPVHPSHPGTQRDGAGIMQGISAARATPPVFGALLLMAVTTMFGSSYISTLPVLAATVGAGGATTLSVLLAASGAGAVIGALVDGSGAGTRTISGAVRRMILLAVCLGGLAWAPNVPSLVLACGVVAAVNISVVNTLNIIIQRSVDDRHRGRVMSLFFIAWAGLLPVGGLLMGLIAHFLNLAVALTISAAALGVAVAVHTALQRREVRSLRGRA